MASSVEKLIKALELCIPMLDPAPLRHDTPKETGQSDILQWLYEHLGQQDLMVYDEWKEYFGHVPDLDPLAAIDFSGFDSEYVVGIAGDIDEEDIPPELMYAMPYEMPYLEYLNSFLKNHGLRVVYLLPFENAYMIAVKDDPQLLDQFSECLRAFEMDINRRNAMNEQEVKAHLDRLLSSGS